MLDRNVNRRDFVRLGGTALSLPLLTGLAVNEEGFIAAIRAEVQRQLSRGVPSLSLAVFQRGIPIWVEAFGWANRERRIPARVTTPYAIASATKPFTGLAIVQLVTAQRINLDEPLSTYLDGVSIDTGAAGAVTVRQALQHRSGIPRHWRNYFAGQGSPPLFSEVAKEHAFVTAAHGRRYQYSNTNYGLLAAAVAKVADQPFHSYLGQNILRPLALTTAAPLEAHFQTWRAAVPYEEDGTPIPSYLPDEVGARDLVMSAFDLARFGYSHLSGRLGQPGKLMLTERAEIGQNGLSKASYGLGWVIEEESSAAIFSYGHTGDGPGASSSLTIVPDEELVVATMANQQGPAAYMLNEMIVDALSPTFAERRKAHPFQELPPDEGALLAVSGQWRGELQTRQGTHTAILDVRRGAASTISVGDHKSPLTDVAVRDGVLTGRAEMSIPAASAQRWPHQARISLELVGLKLDGTLAAYASRAEVPHEQFWLSYRLQLSRA